MHFYYSPFFHQRKSCNISFDFPGFIIPISMATSITTILSASSPSYREFGSFYFAPNICAFQRSLESIFNTTWYYGSFVSVLFRFEGSKVLSSSQLISFCRFVAMKYADRGLADDRFWFNGNLRLFKTLFWFANIFFIVTQGGIIFGHLVIRRDNIYLRAFRCQIYMILRQ